MRGGVCRLTKRRRCKRCPQCGPCICERMPAPPALFEWTDDRDEALVRGKKRHAANDDSAQLARVLERLQAEQAEAFAQLLRDRKLLPEREQTHQRSLVIIPGRELADLRRQVAAIMLQ